MLPGSVALVAAIYQQQQIGSTWYSSSNSRQLRGWVLQQGPMVAFSSCGICRSAESNTCMPA